MHYRIVLCIKDFQSNITLVGTVMDLATLCMPLEHTAEIVPACPQCQRVGTPPHIPCGVHHCMCRKPTALSPEHTKQAQSRGLATWGQFNLMYAESQLKSQQLTSSQAMGHLCTSRCCTITLMKTTAYH